MTTASPLVLRRLLALRSVPALTNAALPDLATLAENLTEVTLDAGTVITAAGSRVGALHLIIEGGVEIVVPGRSVRGERCGPRALVGELEALSGRPAAADVVAVADTRALRLAASEYREVLEDSFSLLEVTLRELAGRLATGASALPRTGAAPMPSPLGMVERLILLRQQMPFARGRLQALASLAHACEEVTWSAGARLAEAGVRAAGTWLVLEGTVRADRPGATAGPGAALGLLESLAGCPIAASIEAATPGRGLWCASAAIFDVIEDHTDLGLAMLAAMAGALLDTPGRA